MNYKSSPNQNDILLSSPIYNLKYHIRTHSQEEQTSATGSISEYSIKPKKIKKFLKNRVIPSLNIPPNITTLVPNIQIKSRNRVISTPSFIDSLPNISQRSIDEKEKKKDNLFLTTYHIPKDKLIENKIKKIFLKHNLFTNPKKNNPISPTLSLIKENDLTKKRYYFGFMTENTINSNNNTNSNNETKRNISLKSIRNNLSIISKTEGLKKRIDKILNKPKKIISLKNSKIKLGPLNFNTQIKNKKKLLVI